MVDLNKEIERRKIAEYNLTLQRTASENKIKFLKKRLKIAESKLDKIHKILTNPNTNQ